MSRPASATWGSAATGPSKCSPCSRSASTRAWRICQIFYHDIQGSFTEYSSDKYQNNTDIQPSLLFKELKPETESDPQLKLPFGIERLYG